MAQVNVNFDTNTKDFSVTLNGINIPSVEYFRVYKFEDKPEMEIGIRENIDSEDMRVYTSITAQKNNIDNYKINSDKIMASVFKMLGKNPDK